MQAIGCITSGSKVHVYGQQGRAGLLQASKQHNLQLVCRFYSQHHHGIRQMPYAAWALCFVRCIMSSVDKFYLLIVVWDKRCECRLECLQVLVADRAVILLIGLPRRLTKELGQQDTALCGMVCTLCAISQAT